MNALLAGMAGVVMFAQGFTIKIELYEGATPNSSGEYVTMYGKLTDNSGNSDVVLFKTLKNTCSKNFGMLEIAEPMNGHITRAIAARNDRGIPFEKMIDLLCSEVVN